MSARTDRAELLGAVLVVGAALWFVVDHVAHDDFLYVMFGDRDMARSDVPFSELPASGPELWLGWGARIPGGGLHVLWWLALRVFGASPAAVWVAQWSLFGVGATALGVVVGRTLGVLPGALAFSLALTSTPAMATLQTLWNPGFTIGLALLALAGTVWGLSRQDPRWIVPTLLTLALALQTHMSAGLLAMGLVGVWAFMGPAGTVRWGAAGLGLSLLGWVSYVRQEVASGWLNTRLLLAPEQLETIKPGRDTLETRLSEVGRVLDMLFGGCSVWWSPSASAGAATAFGVLVLWGMVERRGADVSVDARRLGRVGAWLVVFVVLAYLESSVDAGSRQGARYLVAVTGAAPLWVAACLAGTSGVARRVTAVALVAVTVGIAVAQLGNVQSERRAPTPSHWTRLATWTGEVRAHTGWTLAELTGRTVIVHGGVSKWRRFDSVGLDWALRQEGEVFPGSLAPPCAAYVDHDVLVTQDQWATTEVLSRALVYPPVRSIDALVPMDPQRTLVLYTPDSDHCPTTFGARYLVTPEEELSRDPVGFPEVGTAVRLPDDADGLHRWRFAFPLAVGVSGPVPALLTAAVTGEQVELVLHANGLRGRGWNYGFFENASLVGPSVVSRDAAGAELGRLVFTTGIAGGAGALTPLRVAGRLPPGQWVFEAVSDRTGFPDMDVSGPGEGPVPVSIPLPR